MQEILKTCNRKWLFQEIQCVHSLLGFFSYNSMLKKSSMQSFN